MKSIIIISILVSFGFQIQAQTQQTSVVSESGKEVNFPNRSTHILPIRKAQGSIRIDGSMDEPDWSMADVMGNFSRITPIDTGYSTTKTEVRVTYNDKAIFILAKCYDDLPGENIIASLRRDFDFPSNDCFIAYIDTYNDQTNGFSFGVSAGGAQYEGIQSNGGDVSTEWDCKWESAVKHYSQFWIVEMSIPIRNLKFQPEVSEWGINFTRNDLKRNEKSSWAPVPRQFRSSTLAFAGTLLWNAPPLKPKTNISLIPYISGNVSKDLENNEEIQVKGNAGIDLKAPISPTLNLDVTINPDYSQVDVDEQVTNLDRFELFFPEKRKFFLENQDIFAGFGKRGMRPFFSRRIGLTSPVLVGARLSGNLDNNWRVGLLNMQTRTENEFDAANYTVASVQRRIFARSSIGLILVNKNLTVPETETDIQDDQLSYNRVLGLDYNLASSNNRWTGKAFIHKSFSPNEKDKDLALSTNLKYSTQQTELEWVYDKVGENYSAETGFIRRTGLHRFSPSVGYKFFPKSEKIISHGPVLQTEFLFDPQFKKTDQEIRAAYEIEFLNTRIVEISYKNLNILLLEPFDPTNTDGDTLAAGTEYNWSEFELEYQSDARKRLNFGLETGYGGFFNGTRFNFSSQISYRFQPYGSLSLNMSYDNLQFPEPYKDTDFLLVGIKADITFTKSLFLTAFLQYNEQMDNFNTNIRFQWRYRPVSDLFIVYSDNYLPYGMKTKNRSLVIKLSYWFN
jgi:hypothetical protein